MVVKPFARLPETVSSYRIGHDGPPPLLTLEILSPRTAQQGDLTLKPIIYSSIQVPEYILVDTVGYFLDQRLLIRRLQAEQYKTPCSSPPDELRTSLPPSRPLALSIA